MPAITKVQVRNTILIFGGLLIFFLMAAMFRAIGPTLSCLIPQSGPPQPGLSARTIPSGGEERCYLLYVPADLDPGQPVPLVVSMHGFAHNPTGQMGISGWNPIAEREGFIVVYPQGTSFPMRWRSTSIMTTPADDIQFLQDLLAEVVGLVSIDEGRIYVNGFSNGGAMSIRAGCELSDSVAAIGAVGAPHPALSEDCMASRPVPLIAFHGAADPLVEYSGASFGGQHEYLGAEAWVADWAARNGCDPQPVAIPATGDASGVHYTNCQENAEAILYTIDGGGHTWPGGLPIPFVGKVSHDIQASEVMWAFFLAHPMSGQP